MLEDYIDAIFSALFKRVFSLFIRKALYILHPNKLVLLLCELTAVTVMTVSFQVYSNTQTLLILYYRTYLTFNSAHAKYMLTYQRPS